MGAIPGLPKVHLHNPVLAFDVGDDCMKAWYQAERGEIENFVLVVEGSIPNEHLSGDGYWAAIGTDPATGQPIKTTEWIDRLAPKALAVVGAGTCAAFGGIPAMQSNPTGCMGPNDYLGRRPRLQDDRRHHDGAEPVHRRLLPRDAADEPTDPRDVLPDGGLPCPPVDAVPRRRRYRADGAAAHRLPDG